MNLCCLVCIDKQLVTVGKLSRVGNSNAKAFTTDPKFVVKLLVDSKAGRLTKKKFKSSSVRCFLLFDSQFEVPLPPVLQLSPRRGRSSDSRRKFYK
jgi:hypothetical protein